MKWMSRLGWTALFVVVAIPLLFIGSFFYFEGGDFRKDWEKKLAREMLDARKGERTVYLIKDLFGDNWQEVCVIAPYIPSRLILAERFSSKFAEEKSVTYLDNSWGLLLIGKNEAKHIEFRQGEMSTPSPNKPCLPYKDAVIELDRRNTVFRSK